MRPARCLLFTLAALAPVSVQLHSQGDTLATVRAADGTVFEVMAGAGDYSFISRGCEGRVLARQRVSFRDAAARVEVPIATSPLHLGVRAGIVRDDFAAGEPGNPASYPVYGSNAPHAVIENRYVNPYLTLAGPGGSVGAGVVCHEHEFTTAGEGAREQRDHPMNDVSAHVRFGGEPQYFEIRWMEGVPLYSSGGYLTLGVGGHPGDRPLAVYLGLGAGGPYEGAGLFLQAAQQFDRGVAVQVRARMGVSGGAGAYGAALGLGYTMRPR